MNLSEGQELKKEFQLERIILFSDAVFAIILTIMVIELRLPEGLRDAPEQIYRHAFEKIYIQLAAYGLSFFFVGMFWTRHVNLLGFLKDYNRSVLILNLLFLFSISLFPFAVSMITGFNKIETLQARWGFNVYVIVIFFSMLTFGILTGYLIKNKERLCYASDEIEAKLKWRVIKATYYLIPVMIILVITLNTLKFPPQFMSYVIALYGISVGLLSRRYYPKPIDKDSRPVLLRMFSRRAVRQHHTKHLHNDKH